MIMEAYGSGLFGFTLNATTFGALIGVLLTALATFVASVVVILILKRIPILNNLVP